MNAPAVPTFSAQSTEFATYIDANNLIGGEWVDPSNDAWDDVINPRHGKAMARVAMSGAEDVDAAVKAAKAAYKNWSQEPIRERAQVFYRLKTLMERDVDELAWLVSHENGKTFAEARAEVLKGIECVEYGCSLPQMAGGSGLEVSRGVTCQQVYEPIGVVAGVAPFNFPNMVPLWMLPQALVGGNAFVLKPSEQVPLSMIRLAELLREAGLPDGVYCLGRGGGIYAVSGGERRTDQHAAIGMRDRRHKEGRMLQEAERLHLGHVLVAFSQTV